MVSGSSCNLLIMCGIIIVGRTVPADVTQYSTMQINEEKVPIPAMITTFMSSKEVVMHTLSQSSGLSDLVTLHGFRLIVAY